MTGTVSPGVGCKPAAKKSAESGGPIVLGVSPRSGVAEFPLTRWRAVTVAVPDRPDPAGQVPRATLGPPVKVIQFARAMIGHTVSTTAIAPIALVMLEMQLFICSSRFCAKAGEI